MSLIGTPDEQRVADAWKAAMEDVLKVQDQNQIPELNVYQCGAPDALVAGSAGYCA